MDPIETIAPNAEVLKFFSDYMLRGVKNLNMQERAVYRDFLKMLQCPQFVIDPSKVNIEDVMNAGKPGAIIRRRDDG